MKGNFKYTMTTECGVCITGDMASIQSIFNNFDGVDITGCEGYTHREWLDQMAYLLEVPCFKLGTKITITAPSGVLLASSRIGLGQAVTG